MASKETVLIVGGSSGIGLAAAHQFAQRGAAVHVAARNQERLDAVERADPAISTHRADGSDAARISGIAAEIAPVDRLVVTLSGSDGPGPMAELDLDVLRGAFDAKLWPHLTTIQATLPHLAPEGSITLLGAITAHAGMAGTAGIAALNGAVEALVRPLAVELAPRRVNAVSPGLVDTPWWSGIPEEAKDEYFAAAAQALPTGRIASAEEVAEAVVFAASNPNLTGTVIESDGGARLVSMP